MRRDRLNACLLNLLVTAGVVVSCHLDGAADEPATPKPRVPFTISTETTRLTEPVREDGYVDYVKALNLRYSQGITPETNAAVLFLRAGGPGSIDAAHRDRYFELLGIETLPEDSQYFLELSQYVDRIKNADGKTGDQAFRESVVAQQERAVSRPWSKPELPHIAKWLEMNDAPLKLIVAGCARSESFMPLIPDGAEGTVVGALLPQAQQLRGFTRALVCRAMLRLSEGDAQGAWQDLRACFRMGRLAGHGPTAIHRLVGIAIEGMAGNAARELATSGLLDGDQIAAIQADLIGLPKRLPMADVFDEGERFMFLDASALLTRKDRAGLEALGLDAKEASGRVLHRLLNSAVVDWDKILRMGNQWFDRIVEAARKPTRSERLAEFGKLEVELKERSKSISAGTVFKSLLELRSPRQTVSETIGNILVALITPAFEAAMNAEDRGEMNRQLTALTFILAAYRHDRGVYPQKLAELTPRFTPVVPNDLFSGGELFYQAVADGYVLYSVGENGKDDGGKSYGDTPRGDDLVVRTRPR